MGQGSLVMFFQMFSKSVSMRGQRLEMEVRKQVPEGKGGLITGMSLRVGELCQPSKH